HHDEQYPRRKAHSVAPEIKLPPAADQAAKTLAETEDAKKGDHAGPAELGAPVPAINLDGATASPPPPPTSAPKSQDTQALPSYLHPGRDGGGTASGENTPHEMSDDGEDAGGYFPDSNSQPKPKALETALRRAKPQRKATPDDIERWAQESGMGRGLRADALGDEPEEEEPGEEGEVGRAEVEDKSLRGSVY
ncbi:hypothetical protein LTR53_018197, partial [Teratosphaeriaceae sp. CCFEE 6253]